jgi:hypothetical protein
MRLIPRIPYTITSTLTFIILECKHKHKVISNFTALFFQSSSIITTEMMGIPLEFLQSSQPQAFKQETVNQQIEISSQQRLH